VEASHVRLRERVFAVCDRAEPGNPPARGTEKITDGGGMSTGNPIVLILPGIDTASLETAHNNSVIAITEQRSDFVWHQ